MLRRFLTLGFGFILVSVLAPTQIFAGIIEVNINGGGWFAVGVGGTFNTGNNTNCGIAANCAENSAINVLAGGIAITGAVAFTTTDVAGSTTSALEQATLTIDNTNACCAGAGASTNVLVAFVSDEFDPSVAGPAGVGIFGAFANDGNGNAPFVTADSQGQMNYLANGGAWNGAPGFGSFSLTTPLVGWTGVGPVPFWELAVGGSVGSIQELVGVVGADVSGDSEVTFPVTIEDDDTSFLDAEAPEPASFLLLGVGLAAVGLSRRRMAR
jgi:hypothetical protein